MIRRLLCSGLLLLAACSNSEEKDDPAMSAEEVAAQLATVKVEPGQWESTTEIVSAKGALPEAALKQMTGQRTNVTNCITPEQAARPSANFLAAQQGSECTYHAFQIKDGKLSGRMTCRGGSVPGEVVTSMSGDYRPESYDMIMDMETPGMPGAGNIQIRARAQGRRVGECTAANS